ncbi:FadR/GntR family transcriptional regulator [Sphingomonas abietis]|uniref:FadR/GntR family transcriptional regulator n=1 Tax=Sphingomonas abietis TaxID=3012344 RepID=A0ABY7NNR2_9SPHN|nr:FadR/GntR family transcriptional regulator [Sphingomonas abietis]WBO23169.1 FadR/GntR family transcriptional regulator [Sphingomonas abietis]
MNRPNGRNLTYGMLDSLGRAIITGAYQDIPFPTEADLATLYGVSRSVTREAVKMLTAKGLLSARPRQGTSVRPEAAWNLFDADVLRWLLERKFSLTLLRQFSELRVTIEPAAAALAAQAGNKAALAQIAASYRRMEAHSGSPEEALDADIVFHIAILEASGNPFYAQFRDVVETALRTSIRFTNRFQGRTASLPAHKAVADAIAARDSEGARSAMTAIIADVLVLIAEGERQAPGS